MPAAPYPVSGSAPDTPTVRQLRHRSEVPMLVMGGALSTLALLLFLVLAAGSYDVPAWVSGIVLAVILGPILLTLVGIRLSYWSTISNATESGPDQFPELFERYVEVAQRMGMTGAGMDALPRLYVINGNGLMNAYSSKCQVSRAYVVIYSDLVDIAYEHGDFTAVKFVLAHELGHIKCRHVSIWRTVLYPAARLLLLANSITRAQEYTADRVAGYYVPEGAMGLMAVIAGKRMYRRVDLDAYFGSVARHKDGFWMSVANVLANHPVGFRRLTTLRRISTEGWDVHGPMM